MGGSFQYTDPTHGGSDSQNLEGTVGYRVPFGHVVSVVGSAGIGARFVGSDDAFAYYVLRIGADLRLTDRITWNAIGYRYRNAFDTDNDYDTPQLSDWSRLQTRSRKYGLRQALPQLERRQPDETGLALGFKHEF